jgi:AAA domain-containing protein/bifunctional DNA primase/polymerase-like protein/primase-like protein
MIDKERLLTALKYMPGCVAFPLRRDDKTPRDNGWQKRAYDSAAEIDAAIEGGYNVGIRLSSRVVVIDSDKRNWTNGKDPFVALAAKLGLNPDDGPRWKTGGGGYHQPYIIPAEYAGKLRKTIEGYDGLDILSGQGMFIVAPGSKHPNGKFYEVERDSKPRTAPASLLRIAQRPETTGGAAGGTYTPEELEHALASLDAEAYDTHDKWFQLMVACHHATGGEGREEFIEWSKTYSGFADDAEKIGDRWNSFDPKKNDGITYKTLNMHLRLHGDESRIPNAARVGDDFEGDEFEAEGASGGGAAKTSPELEFDIAPYEPKDPTTISMREWMYRPAYIRKFVGLTTATGGAGKSSLILVEAVTMACGKDLLGVEPADKLRVLYWNGEDPQDELERRVEAILKHYGLTKADLDDRLFIKSGRDMPIRVAETDRSGTKIVKPVVRAMVKAIRKHKLDVVIIDPFVSSHGAPENDNGAIEMVVKKWADIADKTNCHVHLSHHTRKANGVAATIEDSRGASALNYAARTRRAINTMTAAEAKAVGIAGDRAHMSFFKADMANSSMTKPAAANDWYAFVSVDLMNGGRDELGLPTPGDSVGVVVRWEYTKTALDLSEDDTRAALAALEEGRWRVNKQADDWAGHAIAAAVGVDLSAPAVRAQIDALIAEWLETGTLEEYKDQDKKRMLKTYVRPSMDFG